MIVQCENCQTKFNVNEALLKPDGTKMKCSRCEKIFKVYPPEPIEVEEPVVEQIEIEPTEPESEMEIEIDSTEPEPEMEIEIDSTEPEPEKEIEIEPTEPEPEMDLDFDDSFEDDIMEDIEDLETEYRKDPDGFGEEDLEASSEDEEEDADEEIEEGEDSDHPVFDEKKKGKSHTLLILGLIILGLVGGAFAIYKYAPDLIPSFILTEKISTGKSKGLDIGARRLEILTVDGSFVNSKKIGRLFVISGKVSNNYPKSRKYILVKGCILDDNGGIVREKTAFAGNLMKEEALVNLSLEEIGATLENRDGIDKNNVNVEPGSNIDFMIVFEKLPDNLSEFTVGPVSSSPNNPETSIQN